MKTLLLTIALGAGAMPRAADDPLRARSVQILQAALRTEERWIKVHAAEALIAAGQPDGVARAFEAELAARGAEPQYRIGIWRVLAQTAPTEPEHDTWIARIVAAFLDTGGPDRLHAAEALGKFGYRAHEGEIGAFQLAAGAGRGSLAADAQWVLANGSDEAVGPLVTMLASEDRGTRNDAAYAIRYLPKLSPASWQKLALAAQQSWMGSAERVTLVSAAFVHAPEKEKAFFKAELLKYLSVGTNDEKLEVCAAIAVKGVKADTARLTPLLDSPVTDVRIGAAQAILRISRR